MIKTINEYEFVNEFQNSDTYKDNFTYDALTALFDYLEEYEDSIGEKIEFDMVALCCEWSEYKNLEELQKDYTDVKTPEELKEKTQVIEFEGGLLVREF